MTEPFTQLFPEWILSESLSQACGDSPKFWNKPVVHPATEPDKLLELSTIFPSTETPVLNSEWVFTIDKCKFYDINEVVFKNTFWALRPDFTIEDQEQILILLEAKSGELHSKTWTNPKERLYSQFLKECKKPIAKGFYYIVPERYAKDCLSCLNNAKYFEPSTDIQTGYITWEDLLHFIDEDLMKTMIDFVLLKGMEGIKKLREWQKKNKTGSKRSKQLGLLFDSITQDV